MHEFKFRTKFLLLLLVIAMVPTILTGVLSYEVSRSSLYDRIQIDLSTQARNMMEQIDRFLYERYNDTQLLISDSTLADKNVSVEEKTMMLKEYLTNLGLYNGIYLLDMDGNLIASTSAKTQKNNFFQEKWFLNTKKLFYNSTDVITSPFTLKPTILFSNILSDEKNKPIGVIVTELNWEIVLEFFKELPATTEVILLNKYNKEIGGGDTKNILNKDWSVSVKNEFKAKDYLVAKTTSTGYLVYKGNFWKLILRTPKNIALSPLSRLFEIMGLLLVIIIVIIILTGITFGKKFINPIRELTVGAEKISQGDLNQKIKVDSEDEIGFLAKTFNKMAHSLKKKQAKLQKALRKEQELKKTKNEIWNTASHKLRTPLTGMRWALEMLESTEEGKLNEKQRNMVNGLVKNTNRLNALVNVLLAAAKLDEGKIELKKEEFYLEDIIKKGIDSKEVDIREKKINVQIPKLDKKKTKLILDQAKTQQIFNSIIDNAVSYNKEGGRVIIKINRGQENVICSISDNGIGMTEREKQKIFHKFVRGEKAAQYDTEGIGLSLYIAKIIVDSSKGKLWFESEKNKGTTFYIELPIG